MSVASLLALGASAAVESANTFGVVKVESSQKQTIIAVPWVQVGTAGNVNVADLVMTSNLTARDTTSPAAEGTGDMLYYYNGSTYDAWELTQEGSSAAKVWTAVQNVTANGITSNSGAASLTALPRGKALILVRANTEPPIYLYGQNATGTATSTIEGAANTTTWNLIAPSMAADAIISPTSTETANVTMAGTPAAGDYIILNSYPTRKFTYVDDSWGYQPSGFNKPRVVGLTVPAGTGAWYVASGESNVTFTW